MLLRRCRKDLLETLTKICLPLPKTKSHKRQWCVGQSHPDLVDRRKPADCWLNSAREIKTENPVAWKIAEAKRWFNGSGIDRIHRHPQTSGADNVIISLFLNKAEIVGLWRIYPILSIHPLHTEYESSGAIYSGYIIKRSLIWEHFRNVTLGLNFGVFKWVEQRLSGAVMINFFFSLFLISCKNSSFPFKC